MKLTQLVLNYLVRLSILEELEIHPVAIGDPASDLSDHVKKDSNGVTTTDSVTELLEVVGEARSIQAFNQVHASMVQGLEAKSIM